MADLTAQERLQPSLLDRLTDDDPGNTQESRDKRVLNLRRIREGVIRDLAWLLNTTNYESVEDLDAYPEVAKSVVNYGIPDLTGKAATGMDSGQIERELRLAIQEFEPRIIRRSLRVEVVVSESHHKAMVLVIEGELWAQPVPERLYLKTEIDLETGAVSVSEHGGRISS